MVNVYLFLVKASQVLSLLILFALLPIFGQDEKAQERTIFELSCSAVCPNPIRRCGACQVALTGCGPAVLKQHSSVSWTTANGATWTVQFKGKNPCQRKKFDVQHPVCEFIGLPGTYRYVAKISGCDRTIKSTFTVIQ